jgi:hypothetical protein
MRVVASKRPLPVGEPPDSDHHCWCKRSRKEYVYRRKPWHVRRDSSLGPGRILKHAPFERDGIVDHCSGQRGRASRYRDLKSSPSEHAKSSSFRNLGNGLSVTHTVTVPSPTRSRYQSIFSRLEGVFGLGAREAENSKDAAGRRRNEVYRRT